MTKTTAAIQALGELLTANADDRTLTYRLLPFGEPGRTNKGKVTASKGTLTLPEPATVHLNLEHDRKRPVGRATLLAEDDDAINATFAIAETSTGDDLLAEATAGLRTGVSVEIENPVIRAGKLLGGTIIGAGAVVAPAFPSAVLTAEDAGDLSPEQLAELSDAGVYVEPDQNTSETYAREVVIDGRTYRIVTETARSSSTTIEPDPDASAEGDEETTDTESEEDEEEIVTATTAKKAASAPATLRGSAAKGGGAKRGDLLATDANPRDLFQLLATAGSTQDTELIAALVDITQSGAIGNTEVPQYVGELWDGRAAERRIVPLFNHADLTSYKVHGWRWLVKPAVGPYTGNKADIPSNAVSTEPVTITAERLAGGHDIDRKYKDFGDEGFWQSYLAAMTESYAVQSDAAVAADVLAAATAVPVAALTLPDGVPEVWAKIVDGVLAVLAATNAMPSSAVVATDLYRQFLLTPQEGGLEYLNAALGFERGTVNGGNFAVLPFSAVAAGNVLVSAREAVTVHELSTTPIRVEAEHIAKAGIDVGVFGYYAVNIHDPGGLALVSGTYL